VCSGRFRRRMRLFHVRSGKTLVLHSPLLLFAGERVMMDEAWPGDIIGIPNHGNLRIGDTLTEAEELHFPQIPVFAPEILRLARPIDPMRAKHLNRALEQLAEEGVATVFQTPLRLNRIVGVVGALQFDVLADRIRTEYDIPVQFESIPFFSARWILADSAAALRRFTSENEECIAVDHTGVPVFLARSAWHLEHTSEVWPEIRFLSRFEIPSHIRSPESTAEIPAGGS
jgi:peptide chain release factor 3